MDNFPLDPVEQIRDALFAEALSDGHCDGCEEDPIETVVICEECCFEVCRQCYDRGPGCKCPSSQECYNCGLVFSAPPFVSAHMASICPACGASTFDDDASL